MLRCGAVDGTVGMDVVVYILLLLLLLHPSCRLSLFHTDVVLAGDRVYLRVTLIVARSVEWGWEGYQ